MSQASIPVDLFNPGQVFACLGLVEAADVLLGRAYGGFDWQDPGEEKFYIEVADNECPVTSVLEFLNEATVKAMAPKGWQHDAGNPKKNIAIEYCTSNAFPFPAPKKHDVLPARIENGSTGQHLTIDHWGDQTRRDAVKFWAGMGGHPGYAIAHNALDLVRGHLPDHVADPFNLAAIQKSSFRFDWRRDYVPSNFGFSPNFHTNITMQGYPVVELLAALGMTHARPFAVDQSSKPKGQRSKQKLEYGYGVAGVTASELYDPIFLRAAIGSRHRPFPGMPLRLFSMHLDWPGQEGKARCITSVTEETPE